jgi:protein ImuB
MLWLSLHFYQLPLDVFLLDDELGLEFSVEEHGQLLYCNQTAVNNGLQPGMKISTAHALSNSIQLKSRDYELEKRILIQMATEAYQFSSHVCLYDDKTILIEVEASCKLFFNLYALLDKLKKTFIKKPVLFSSALASTAKLSFLLSAYYKEPIDKLVQRVSRKSLAIIKKRSEQQLAMSPLDIFNCESFIAKTRSVQIAKKMGFCKVDELLSLSYSVVGRRFGKNMVNYFHQLSGSSVDPVPLFSLPETFHMKRSFINGIETVEQMLFPAKAMLENLILFLKVRRFMVMEIAWDVDYFNGESFSFEIVLSSEVQSAVQLIMLTRLKLQRLSFKEPVESICLNAVSFSSLNEKQSSLTFFGSDILDVEVEDVVRSASQESGIGKLFDKINARLNMSECSILAVNDEYLPERKNAVKHDLYNVGSRTSLSVISTENTFSHAANCHVGSESLLPLWLLDRPKRLDKSMLSNNILTIESKAERIETAWWDDWQRRDYHIACSQSNVHYWIYYDLDNDCWFLHGVI